MLSVFHAESFFYLGGGCTLGLGYSPCTQNLAFEVLGFWSHRSCTGMHFHSASVNGGIGQAQYRQGQKTRHRLGLSTQSVGKGVEGRDVQTAVAENDGLLRDGNNGYDKSEGEDEYYCPCGKVRSFTSSLFSVFSGSEPDRVSLL